MIDRKKLSYWLGMAKREIENLLKILNECEPAMIVVMLNMIDKNLNLVKTIAEMKK